jgi:hypothetical protein
MGNRREGWTKQHVATDCSTSLSMAMERRTPAISGSRSPQGRMPLADDSTQHSGGGGSSTEGGSPDGSSSACAANPAVNEWGDAENCRWRIRPNHSPPSSGRSSKGSGASSGTSAEAGPCSIRPSGNRERESPHPDIWEAKEMAKTRYRKKAFSFCIPDGILCAMDNIRLFVWFANKCRMRESGENRVSRPAGRAARAARRPPGKCRPAHPACRCGGRRRPRREVPPV